MTQCRSRREIELSFDLPHLTPKKKRLWPRPLSEEEIKRLADKYGEANKKGESYAE